MGENGISGNPEIGISGIAITTDGGAHLLTMVGLQKKEHVSGAENGAERDENRVERSGAERGAGGRGAGTERVESAAQNPLQSNNSLTSCMTFLTYIYSSQSIAQTTVYSFSLHSFSLHALNLVTCSNPAQPF